MRVLYVEDDDNLALAVEQMLTQDGHSCDRVRSGAGAVQRGQTNQYDVILLDVMLPDIDGYEVIRLLQGAGIDTPFLIQSGLVERDREMDGLGFGVDDYLIKPFNRDELIRQIRHVAARSGKVPASAGDGMPAAVPADTVPEPASETVIQLGDESANGTAPEPTAPEATEDETASVAPDEAPPMPEAFPALPAKIVAEEGRIDIDCTVISVTTGGAVLNVYDELIVCPEDFKLAVAGDKSYRCQSCWRHGDKVGVKFL